MWAMNRETTVFDNSDTLVVVDRSRRKRLALIVGGAIAAVALLLAYFMMSSGNDAPAAGAAADPGSQVPTVTVVVPGRELVERSIATTGTLAARVDMPVGVAGEGGMVSSVLVQPGQWVEAGQTLAVIERSVQAEQARQLAAQIEVARAEAALAQNEFERAQALVDRGFVSEADLDRKRAARDAANARVRVAQASLAETRARIGRLNISAPAAGLVLERNVEPGQVVGAGAGALFRIARGGQMEALAQLSEADLAVVPVGAPAEVTPVGTSESFTGSVWQISPVIDEGSRQGIARVALPYDPAIRPGGFASIQINSGSRTAPVLPESAILSDAKGNYVFVVGANNEVQRRPVVTGAVSAAGIAVVEGLNGTEAVVLRAGGFLNEGDKVSPKRLSN